MRYIRSDSELVPRKYREKVSKISYKPMERYWIPYDYVLITRDNGSQFMIAENFSSDSLPNNFHKYSIIRYGGPKESYKEDFIYSEGIDIARLLCSDKEYIDVLANDFLSEKRLNESLDSVNTLLNEYNLDEIDHGGGYVGYINSKDLSICKSLEKNELFLFEEKLKEGVE
jgi:hypothetical protein